MNIGYFLKNNIDEKMGHFHLRTLLHSTIALLTDMLFLTIRFLN